MLRHVVIDTSTGTTFIRDRDGRDHTEHAVAAAERAAAAGDPAAQALLSRLEFGTDLDAMVRQVVHDCPECQAAIAAGEVPMVFGPEHAAMDQRPRGFSKRPRWRDFKRGRR